MQIELINQDLIIIENELIKGNPIMRDGDTIEGITHVHIIPLIEEE